MGVSDYFSYGLVNRVFVNSAKQDLSENKVKRYLRLNVGADWAPGSSGALIVDRFENLIGYVCAARQLMGPSGQPVKTDGKPQPSPTGGLTVLLTAHEAGTSTGMIC